jgi:hypothetical protein
MTTEEIVQLITDFAPFDETDLDRDNESFFYKLMEHLEKNSDFEKAIKPIFLLIEKYPQADFGSPGPLVHTLETFTGRYEKELFNSLDRKPTSLAVWMLNRIINGEKDVAVKKEELEKLISVLNHPDLDEETRAATLDFITFQQEFSWAH